MKLRQPFETSLQDKQQRMDATITAMGQLVNYEIDEVTAAATYYMAETYFNFSRSLIESERPSDLKPEDLEAFKKTSMRQRFRSRRKPSTSMRRTWNCCTPALFNAWTERVSAGLPS